jgi:plasmid stabilization system protein ParE
MNVKISDRAERNLNALVEYLQNKWSVRVKDKFLYLLEKKISQLSKNPSMYEASKSKDVRKCVVTHQTILYYRIKENEIEIITIQDSRRNPKKLKL